MKKIIRLGASTLAVSGAIASVVSMTPVATADPGVSALNVVGEPYGKAVSILRSQGVKATFGGSFGSDLPQAQCIVDQQKALSTRMVLLLNCTQAAANQAGDNAPARPAPAAGGGAPGGPAPGSGQGTYGGPIGVPVPVG